MFFASGWLLYRLSTRWFPAEVVYLAVAIFLVSQSWRYYCNMIQYEVLTGFLMLLFLFFVATQKRLWPSDIAAGALAAFIALIQMRYLALLVIPLLYPMVLQGKKSALKDFRHGSVIVLAALFLLIGWSLAQSSIRGRTTVLMDGGHFRFHVSNNPNAMGYSFPYPAIVEPSGWNFILEMPGRWLWLVGQRALYLLGIKNDIWALPPEDFTSGRIGTYSIFDIFGMIVFAVGVILAEYRCRRGELSESYRAAIVLLACVMLPPLLIFGSKRFIVPVVPLIALFQSYAIVEAAQPLIGKIEAPGL
jgi:hypothetical protein